MQAMNHIPDLIHQCLKGNRSAQKHLYNSYAPKLLGTCMRYARDKAEAEDFLQEGFIKVFHHLKDLRDTSQLEAWMNRIMITTALMHLRKQQPVLTDPVTQADWVPEPYEAETITDTLSREDLLALVQGLPPGFRAVFNLYAIEGYSQKEISEELNITTGTVKSQYARAKQWLQQEVKTLDPELVKHFR